MPTLRASARCVEGGVCRRAAGLGSRRRVAQCVVQSVDFHPAAQVVLTAGFDKRVRLFQVDGTTNALVDSVFIPDLPIRTAKFTRDGSQVICSGRRPFVYSFDVTTGKVTKVDRLIGREERSLERFVVSPDGKLIAFFGNHGYIILASAITKQVRVQPAA